MRHDRHFVDELTVRGTEATIGRMVSISRLVSSLDQPRNNLGDITDLTASIRSHGVLEPLLVRRSKAGDGTFELISGERRLHAATDAGLTEVPCIELDVSDEQAVEIALIENLQRKDLSAFEEAEGFMTLIEKHDYTHERVAEAVGRSRVTISEALKLLAIPPATRDLCRHADITAKGILLEIAKAPSHDAMNILVDEIARLGLDRDDVRRRRQELAGGDDETGTEAVDGESALAAQRRQKPFVMRFRNPDQGFSVALSFRAGLDPEPQVVIAALEAMIQDLQDDLLAMSEGDEPAV